MSSTDFLVIGAGPYGISTAAYARSRGLQPTVVGKPLDFWKTRMPRGMFLRSGLDWHLDALGVHTFEEYARRHAPEQAAPKPVPVQTFVDYAGWFMAQYGVSVRESHVTSLAREEDRYVATLDDGSRIRAEKVLLGLGFAFFKHVPEDLVARLPRASYVHTCDRVDFESYRGARVLIVGGRQSAFEWAALIHEHGAEAVHVALRHETPTFAETDWSWVQPLARRALRDHAWWRKLSTDEQARIKQDFWAAGRLKLEAWLDARVHQPGIHIHERTRLERAVPLGDENWEVALDDHSRLDVHDVILATGYRPDVRKVGFLDQATVLDHLATEDGFPVLDPEFQTSLPNLYVTGLAATRDFGPFFGFTVACPVAAKIIGDAVGAKKEGGRLGEPTP